MIRGDAVLSGPSPHHMAARKQHLGLFGQCAVTPALPVFPRPMAFSTKQEDILPAAHGVGRFLRADPHAVRCVCVFQCQDVGAFLMHSGKVHSRKINKWVMAGKNDFTSSDHSPVGFDLIAVNRPDKGIFIYGQLGGKSGNQLNRVKLCLILKSDGAGRINGKSSRLDKRGGEKDSTSFSPALLKYFFISGHGRRFHERQRPAVSFSRRI